MSAGKTDSGTNGRTGARGENSVKIDELIERLGLVAQYLDQCKMHGKADVCRKAAETIKLLWEIAQDNSNSKYKMQFDEWIGKGEAE